MTTHASDQSSSQTRRAHDGFDTLDACHHEMLQRVEDLQLLVEQLEQHGIDAQARSNALAIVRFFATTAREHHEDEERHVFPPLVRSGDPEVVQAVLRLQQDHSWLEEDWLELSPHVQSVAAGYNGYDVDVLREGMHDLRSPGARPHRAGRGLHLPAGPPAHALERAPRDGARDGGAPPCGAR